ncbi:hypothetical protein CgunFtcFv8_007237 [Champsocephalus gunnari]|uniref:Uncharacterized protein n=1 Tax=Champsocephalus gunnari TaxID=52237 RepID=A0AAN8H5S3_CHAGU|nr:hypothetical protein CgunFtcFv8_007237 [Champsocephalus gunnari]
MKEWRKVIIRHIWFTLKPSLMAPAAGVSEALTAALRRVALATAPCQAACVVNRRLGGGGRARGSRQKPPSVQQNQRRW